MNSKLSTVYLLWYSITRLYHLVFYIQFMEKKSAFVRGLNKSCINLLAELI